MIPLENEADIMIDAACAFLDLPIEDAYRPGVRAHLTAARAMADLVLSFELEDDAEPAPVFTP